MAGLPDLDRAEVDRSKIVDYLLASSRPTSLSKARFFLGLGFTAERWEQFAVALRAQARRAQVTEVAGQWGIKYVAVGPIDGLDGRQYKIVTVWIAEGARLRLVTAYPFKERRE